MLFRPLTAPFLMLAKIGAVAYTERMKKPQAFSNSSQGELLYEEQHLGERRLTGRFAASAEASQNLHFKILGGTP